jgi:hypothetical protein
LYRLNLNLDFAFRTTFSIVHSTIKPREWSSNEWSCVDDGWKLNILCIIRSTENSIENARVQMVSLSLIYHSWITFLFHYNVKIDFWFNENHQNSTILRINLYSFLFPTNKLETISVKSIVKRWTTRSNYFQLHLHCWKQDFQFGHL